MITLHLHNYLVIIWHVHTYLIITWHIRTYLAIIWHVHTYLVTTCHLHTYLAITWHVHTYLVITCHLHTYLVTTYHLHTYLVSKDCERGTSRFKHSNYLTEYLLVVTLWYVSLKTNISKLRFRSDMDSPVLTLHRYIESTGYISCITDAT